LVPPKDKDSLLQALGRLLADRELRERMGERAREYALSRFPIQRVVSEYQDLFAEIRDTKDRSH
jgi:glycosyltransferase involved in cell wall biosynthesis